ncbi:MAG TPA: mechanosensitive ion channel family protein [bacterium]|nr:mechanosensitive ion channel family protein [bacterium]
MPYIRGLLFMAVIWYGTKLALAIVDRFARDAFMTERDEKKGDATTYHLVMMGMRTLAIVIAILLILTNFGVEIAPLLASLGVGGIAIAFALQSVLADIFASISIYFDRPFKIGDYVTVGTDGGHVQKVGIKSTRIKTLEGQELVIPNKDITNVRVNNYATLERRRVILGFSVIYTTPTATIRRVPEIVQEIAQTIPNFTLDRVHFSNFGVYSLDFEVVYYAETAEYAAHMDTKQTFLLALMEAFEREKITFAYPTQTVFVRGMEKPSEETAEFIAS